MTRAESGPVQGQTMKGQHQVLAPSLHVDAFTRDRLPPVSSWPQFIFELPDIQYPERINCAQQLLDRHVQEGRGERPALHGMDSAGAAFTWTYADLLDRVARIGAVLRDDLALVPGNRVLLRGANSPMMAACLLAVLRNGLVAVPTMPLLRATELAQILGKAQVQVALCDQALAEELDHCLDPGDAHHVPSLARVLHFHAASSDGSLEALMARHAPADTPPCETSRDDVCLIAFTSGTTGQPKGTMHFHRDVLAMCDLFPRHILNMQPDDVVCGTPPVAFTFGLGGLLAFPLRYGASSVLIERYSPESLLQTIARHQATQCYTAPTFYRQMAPLAHEHDLTSLRHAVSAGEALPDATRRLWREATGKDLVDGIGGTEMIHIYIASAGVEVRQGAIGKVLPGYQACVVDEQMRAVAPGTPGRLAVRGPTGCRYLDDPRQSDYVREGWNLPGDTFVMDADGYFFYQARNDDMIISAGYNIAGPEVESVLMMHPAVLECGVVGLPDGERGQRVHAFVVLKPGHAGDETMTLALQEHVRVAIAPYKYPRRITYLASLPRTETGKLQRYRLRQMG